jgi:hypothetical protein
MAWRAEIAKLERHSMHRFLLFTVSLTLWIPVQLQAADGNGLKAEFFEGINLDKLVATRQEPSINFDWEHAAPIAELPADGFSLRMTGWLKVPRAGRYTFILRGNDGVRLWLDDKQVINHWNSGDANKEISLELTAEPHAMRFEYFEVNDYAWVTLFWTYPGAKTYMPVPPEAFFLDEKNAKAKPSTSKRIPDENGLNMEVFSDINVTRKVGASGFGRLESVWGDGAPLPDLNPDSFSIRLTGFLQAPVTGRYKVIYFSDNGLRLSIDGKVVFNRWNDGLRREEAIVELKEDDLYPIQLEQMDFGGWSYFYVHWILPDSDKEISIAPEYLFRTKNAAKKK